VAGAVEEAGAEEEREIISAGTKAGIGAARARGVKLGGARPGLEARNAARIATAEAAAEWLRPVLEHLVALRNSLTRIGNELARQAISPRKGRASPLSGEAVLGSSRPAEPLGRPPLTPDGSRSGPPVPSIGANPRGASLERYGFTF
jgi:hypothetical protein